MTDTVLPETYNPFPELIVCTNQFVNGKVVIAIENQPVLLIGTGKPANVWLKCPMGSPRIDSMEWIIQENKEVHSESKVLISGPSLGVYYGDEIILHLTVPEEGQRADIISMDLRPLGIAAFGDMRGLNVGNNKYLGNYFKGVHTMIQTD